MKILPNIPLQNFSTMRLGGTAAYLVEIHSRDELSEAFRWAQSQNLPMLMIGGGSNIVWRDEGFAGLVLVNKIQKYEVFSEDAENYYVTIGAGENWDAAVAKTVAAGATGIEALSLIPGTAGGTPVQNVGAYGQELSSTLVSVEALDTSTGQVLNIPGADCAFGYRTSRFKSNDRGRFFITALTLHLTKGNPQPPFYGAVQNYLSANQITAVTPPVLRDAVIAIRSAKLPDPAKVANTGSFFANPLIDEFVLAQLLENHPDLPYWPAENGQVKLSAAWLIEQAGFKDFHDEQTGMATWPAQPLVLVNEHAKTTADLMAFKQKVMDAVQQKFNVVLVQEPELLP